MSNPQHSIPKRIWITLSHGQAALIDLEDYARVSKIKWWAEFRNNNWVAKGWYQKRNITMHRFILDTPPGELTGHVNPQETLINTRENIRPGKGIPKSKEHRENISKSLLGKPLSEDRKAKLRTYVGPKNPQWKGDDIAPSTWWTRARKATGPIGPCARCGNQKSERHHIDGNCRNNNPDNIIPLCRACHQKEDGRYEDMKKLSFRGLKGKRYKGLTTLHYKAASGSSEFKLETISENKETPSS